jgi:hypothetical protein
MGFSIANYEMDDATSRPIKVKVSTISTANPDFATNSTGSYVRAGGSKKAYGTVARQVIISRPIGTEDPYSSSNVSVSIPFLTKAAFDAISVGASYTYAALTDWIVVAKVAEVTR